MAVSWDKLTYLSEDTSSSVQRAYALVSESMGHTAARSDYSCDIYVYIVDSTFYGCKPNGTHDVNGE